MDATIASTTLMYILGDKVMSLSIYFTLLVNDMPIIVMNKNYLSIRAYEHIEH